MRTLDWWMGRGVGFSSRETRGSHRFVDGVGTSDFSPFVLFCNICPLVTCRVLYT